MNFWMSYKISTIPLFDKQAKRLSKKYPSFKRDLATLIDKLSEEPKQGTALGNNFYKIRLAIASKGKGKSGGTRVITYVKVYY
jgi:mRNA-degrading endonuclease RelE of RelBE toxin-antitoxin system